MKVYKSTEDKECIFVELKDINHIVEIEENQAFIQFLESFESSEVIEQFIGFENKEDIEYIKGLNWILDYDKTAALSKSKMDRKYDSIALALKKISEKLVLDPDSNIFKKEYKKKQYAMEDLKKIYAVKTNLLKMKYLTKGEDPNDYILANKVRKLKREI